jgi:hypothetical protein
MGGQKMFEEILFIPVSVFVWWCLWYVLDELLYNELKRWKRILIRRYKKYIKEINKRRRINKRRKVNKKGQI